MRERRRLLSIDQSTQDPDDPEISLLVLEKQKTIKAIEALKYEVSAPEIAAQSGLSINQASFWLNKVAGETKGRLEVKSDGNIVYSFDRNFKNAYLQRGFRKTLLIVGAFAFQMLYWAVRVSFGVALILSVLIVIVLIIAVAIAASSDSGSGDGGGDWGGFFDINFLGDLFSWNYSPSSTYYPNSRPSSRRNRYEKFREENPKGNFFLECFSFLFGDGAPNSNLQEIRWQQLARVIAENGGVVSTEQLAPFLDGDSSDSGMILSALAQFNGRPEVTRSGFIVYIFPDFLDPASSPQLPDIAQENYLREDNWRFSAYPPDKWIPVMLLAMFNFAGSWWLFKHIATVTMLHYFALLIDFLLGYAILLLLIPLLRFLVLCVLNQRVSKRNELRKKAFEQVRNPQGEILKEIQEAAEIRMEEQRKLPSAKPETVYISDRDLLEQEFQQGKEPN